MHLIELMKKGDGEALDKETIRWLKEKVPSFGEYYHIAQDVAGPVGLILYSIFTPITYTRLKRQYKKADDLETFKEKYWSK